MCRKYNNTFRKLATAQTYVSRVIKRVKDAVQNGEAGRTPGLMRDQRSVGKSRQKPVSDNPHVKQVLERICEMNNASIKRALHECQTLRLKASASSLRKLAVKLGFKWQKPWHTDVLTPAQKYKRVLFCQKLLGLSRENLLRTITAWLFTDEKWFDIIGPSPGRWVRGSSKAHCKMENQVMI